MRWVIIERDTGMPVLKTSQEALIKHVKYEVLLEHKWLDRFNHHFWQQYYDEHPEEE